MGAKKTPEKVHEMYHLASRQFEKENYEEARRLLEKLAEEAPFFADVYNKLGFIYHQDGAFGKAAKAFEKALELNPKYTEASLSLAVTYNNLGRYEDSEAIFHKAAAEARTDQDDLDPFIKGKLANQHAALADIYFDLGLYDEATDEYRKAVGLGKSFADLHTKLAIAHREQGDFDEALKQFQAAMTINAKYIPAYLHLGITHYKRGQIDEAVAVWEKAIAVNPNARTVKVYLEFIKNRKDS
jgi:tetratricopeptide (TPR) repeat protein